MRKTKRKREGEQAMERKQEGKKKQKRKRKQKMRRRQQMGMRRDPHRRHGRRGGSEALLQAHAHAAPPLKPHHCPLVLTLR